MYNISLRSLALIVLLLSFIGKIIEVYGETDLTTTYYDSITTDITPAPPPYYETYTLPMVPSGSYLDHCSYNFIRYDKTSDAGVMKAECGPEKMKASIPLSDMNRCLQYDLDILWNPQQGLHCGQNNPRRRSMIGNDAVPDGPYMQSCSGALMDHESNTLYASCLTGKSDYTVSSLSMYACTDRERAGNKGGRLACVSFDENSGKNGIPLGSYLNQCPASGTRMHKNGTLTTFYSTTYTKKRECTHNCSYKDLKKIIYTHTSFNSAQYDASQCQSEGRNICLSPDQTFFCSRYLMDDQFIELTPSKMIVPGSYLQYCNYVFYDEKSDILNAVCAAHKQPSEIFGKFPIQGGDFFEDTANHCHHKNMWTCGHETPDSAFVTNHPQVVSTMSNAAKCVDKNNTSQISIDEQGKLVCEVEGNFKLSLKCGHPIPIPTPTPVPNYDCNSGNVLAATALGFSIFNFISAGSVIAVIYLYFQFKLRSNYQVIN